ncbi:MAG TPA: superoxide dismutase family protein [Limnochordales bacterium]
MAGRPLLIGAVRLRALVLASLAVAGVAVALALMRQSPAKMPQAVAKVQGGPLAPRLRAEVVFRAVPGGVEVSVEAEGLPPYLAGDPPIGPNGFHLHEVGDCTVGDPTEPFLAAGGHYNPDGQRHGNHAGDFPVLFSNAGVARMRFFTDRLRIDDVVGRAVVIHENPDDYRTDPAGNSGRRLGCGVVTKAGPQ